MILGLHFTGEWTLKLTTSDRNVNTVTLEQRKSAWGVRECLWRTVSDWKSTGTGGLGEAVSLLGQGRESDCEEQRADLLARPPGL